MSRKKENIIITVAIVLLLFIGWFQMVDGPKWAKQELAHNIEQVDFFIDDLNAMKVQAYSEKYREYQRSQGLRVCEYCRYTPEEYPIPE